MCLCENNGLAHSARIVLLVATPWDMHIHLIDHIEGGNYIYIHSIKTAYPKYDYTAHEVQTFEGSVHVDTSPDYAQTMPGVSGCTHTIDKKTTFSYSQNDIAQDNLVKPKDVVPREMHDGRGGLEEQSMLYHNQSRGAIICDNSHMQQLDIANDITNETKMQIDSTVVSMCRLFKEEYTENVLEVSNTSEPSKARGKRKRKKDVYSAKQKRMKDIKTVAKADKKTQKSKLKVRTAVADRRYDTSPVLLDNSRSLNSIASGGSVDEIIIAVNMKLEDVDIAELKGGYTCRACGIQVMTSSAWEQHVECHHYHNYTLQCDKCFSPFLNEADSNTHNCFMSMAESHICRQCNDEQPFKYRKNLLKHIDIEHGSNFPLVCDVCFCPLISELDKRKHMPKHDPSLLECNICRKSFKGIADLDRHVTIHTGETNFHCHLCDKQYRTKEYLRDHITQHGVVTQLCICEICGNSFGSSKQLRKHIRNTCSNPAHACVLCNKRFRQRDSLLYHIRSNHTGYRPYICDKCGDSFAHPNTLNNHVKHKHTNDRQHKCTMCDKAFVKTCTLKRHERVHLKIRQYVCEYCEKEFSTPWNLKAHMRQHTGDTPYICTKCGLGFAHNVVRKTHERKCLGVDDPSAETSESNSLVLDMHWPLVQDT